MNFVNKILTRQDPLHADDNLSSLQDPVAIQTWLVTRLAEQLDVPPEEIDIRQDFTEYGLNSIEAVNLSGGLEHFLGCRLEPTLVWDYPNIYTLVQYLAGGSASAGLEAPTDPEIQPADAQQLLANLDQMPDETVDALLNSMLPVEESA